MAEKTRTWLGDFIYQRRKALGITQSELALALGITNKAVSKWETLEANPDLQLIPRLAEVLKVTTDELLACRMDEQAAEADGAAEAPPFFLPKGTVKRTETSYEYVSERRTRKGTPLIHIAFGSREGKTLRAHGVLAIGGIARGVLSLGLVSVGIFSMGVVSIGLIAMGVVALGLAMAVGGIAAGIGVSVGGAAAGFLAVGGVAVGFLAVGGVAVGVYAHTGTGGIAIGLHTFVHASRSASLFK